MVHALITQPSFVGGSDNSTLVRGWRDGPRYLFLRSEHVPRERLPPGNTVLGLRTTTSQNCEAVQRRARIEGS